MSVQDWQSYLRYWHRVGRLPRWQIAEDWQRLDDRNSKINAANAARLLLNAGAQGGGPGAGGGGPGAGGGQAAGGGGPGPNMADVAVQADGDRGSIEPVLILDHDQQPVESSEEQRTALLRANIGEDLEGRWVGAWSLTGGKNAAGIWVQPGDQDTVEDRIVVKDIHVKERHWLDVRKWDLDRHRGGWQPTEYSIQRRLRRSPNDRHFAGVRKCRVFSAARMYRLYIDYCQHGNGDNLMRTFDAKKERIPEPMLWNIFEALAEAAIVMEQGALLKAAAEPDWLQVVHRDIKPDNVFFDSPQTNKYPAYAKPVLGDFGGAMQTSEQDPMNPQWHVEEADPSSHHEAIGAIGYQAPEAQAYRHHNETQRILAHTNVWGIGATMISFMDLCMFGDGVQEINFTDANNNEPEVFTEEAKAYYSNELKNLVAECVRFGPTDRIEARALLNAIRDCAHTQDLANGLRNRAQPRRQAKAWEVEPRTDLYALGLARAQLPSRKKIRKRDDDELQGREKPSGGGTGHNELDDDADRALRDRRDEADEPRQTPAAPGNSGKPTTSRAQSKFHRSFFG